jgi:hypothetical protein
VLAEEVAHEGGNFVAVGFEGEMAGIDEMEIDRLNVAFVWFGAGGREDFVVLAQRSASAVDTCENTPANWDRGAGYCRN